MSLIFEGLDFFLLPHVVISRQVTVATAGTELPIVPINYNTGTITVTDGSTTLVGIGTSFVGNVSVGDVIETAGLVTYFVAAVTDDTHLELSTEATATETGVAYSSYTLEETVRVILRADNDNAGKIFVGGVGVSSTTGLELNAGDELTLKVNNKVSNIHVDAGSNNQKVFILIERGGIMETRVPTSIATGQRTSAGGGEVQLVATKVNTVQVVIEALSTNAASAYVGVTGLDATSGYELTPGKSVVLNVNDHDADVYVYLAAGEKVSYLITKP
ncbi:hypothetical protein C4561_01565 [candidate division WWE3 bacterium]|uniref:Uncharacterized protein n=1 Tax=candidate division WWE3 bacterium TaxID=2053526 RepID=A0A3A4ZF59_UNCKA|nr:MAG: hypothetical protein C4561_01565 [candidate division WWE3 bacterium]